MTEDVLCINKSIKLALDCDVWHMSTLKVNLKILSYMSVLFNSHRQIMTTMIADKRFCDISYKDVNTIIWSQDIVQDELSIDKHIYTLLLLKLQT